MVSSFPISNLPHKSSTFGTIQQWGTCTGVWGPVVPEVSITYEMDLALRGCVLPNDCKVITGLSLLMWVTVPWLYCVMGLSSMLESVLFLRGSVSMHTNTKPYSVKSRIDICPFSESSVTKGERVKFSRRSRWMKKWRMSNKCEVDRVGLADPKGTNTHSASKILNKRQQYKHFRKNKQTNKEQLKKK